MCHFWGVGTPVARVSSIKIWAWVSGLGASWLPLGCLLFEFLESVGMCSRCLLFPGAPFPRKQRFSWGFTDFLGVFLNAAIFHSTPHPCPTPRLLPKDQIPSLVQWLQRMKLLLLSSLGKDKAQRVAQGCGVQMLFVQTLPQALYSQHLCSLTILND